MLRVDADICCALRAGENGILCVPIKEIFSTSYVGDDQNKCVYNIMMIFARWRAKSLRCAAVVCLLQTARMMIFVRMCQTYNTDIKNNIICSMLVFRAQTSVLLFVSCGNIAASCLDHRSQ